jgi:magnesium transporter
MQPNITNELIEKLHAGIREKDEALILELIGELHSTDIAEIFDEITVEDANYLYTLIDEEKAAEVITWMDENSREKFLAQLSSKQIAEQFVENLDSDDAADILSELSEERQREVISEIQDKDIAEDVTDLLKYEEDTAGGLMAKELVKINVNWSREKVVQEVREQAFDIENIYTTYVVDDSDKLLGIISLKKLLIEPDTSRIEDMYNDKIQHIDVNASKEYVAEIMQKYDLVVIPVVDGIGRLVGRITIDDALDVITEEADKDFQLMSGLTEQVESDDKIWVLTRARMPWLVVGLLGGLVGARVISSYEGQLQIYPEMAFFTTLIAGMGGNAGVQSSAIIVQGLANNTLRRGDTWAKFLKEVSVAFLNGIVLAVIVFAYGIFTESLPLAITISTALMTVIIVASVLGTFIPLTLNRFKVDPALATGPFITTLNDITGIFIYFMIGRLMYGLF